MDGMGGRERPEAHSSRAAVRPALGHSPRMLCVLLMVLLGAAVGGCSISLPWEKDTATSDTTAVSTSGPATTLQTDDTTSGGGEVFGTTTTTGSGKTTRTTTTGVAGYETPEAAVKAVAPAGWVLKVASRETNRAEVWAGPPQSEFVTAYVVQKGSAGWVVIEEAPIGGDEPGDGGYLVGGPWYEEDFPEIFEPGSGLYVPFRSDAYPVPDHSGYPQNNAGARAVWLSLGEMLNNLKEGYITDATWYVTADFYRHFYFDFFNAGEPTSFNEFELMGWQEAGGDEFQIWANLYSSDAVSTFLRRAVFTGVSFADGTGLMVWVELWEPTEL